MCQCAYNSNQVTERASQSRLSRYEHQGYSATEKRSRQEDMKPNCGPTESAYSGHKLYVSSPHSFKKIERKINQDCKPHSE